MTTGQSSRRNGVIGPMTDTVDGVPAPEETPEPAGPANRFCRAGAIVQRGAGGPGARRPGRLPRRLPARPGGSGSAAGRAEPSPSSSGLIVICIFFEVQSSAFFTATNIVNLFVQAAFIVLLGMAELYALDPQRDRPLRRLRRCRRRRHRHGAHRLPAELAVVGRAHRRHGGVCGHRRLPGHDHHETEDPVVRRHPGRLAGLAGRLDLRLRRRQGRGRRRDQHLQQRHRRPGQRQHDPGRPAGSCWPSSVGLFAARLDPAHDPAAGPGPERATARASR